MLPVQWRCSHADVRTQDLAAGFIGGAGGCRPGGVGWEVYRPPADTHVLPTGTDSARTDALVLAQARVEGGLHPTWQQVPWILRETLSIVRFGRVAALRRFLLPVAT